MKNASVALTRDYYDNDQHQPRENIMTDNSMTTVEEFLAIRKEAGLKIDPDIVTYIRRECKKISMR